MGRIGYLTLVALWALSQGNPVLAANASDPAENPTDDIQVTADTDFTWDTSEFSGAELKRIRIAVQSCERLNSSGNPNQGAEKCYRDSVKSQVGKAVTEYRSALTDISTDFRKSDAFIACAKNAVTEKRYICLEELTKDESEKIKPYLSDAHLSIDHLDEFLSDHQNTWVGLAFADRCGKLGTNSQKFGCLRELLRKYESELSAAHVHMAKSTVALVEANSLSQSCVSKIGTDTCRSYYLDAVQAAKTAHVNAASAAYAGGSGASGGSGGSAGPAHDGNKGKAAGGKSPDRGDSPGARPVARAAGAAKGGAPASIRTAGSTPGAASGAASGAANGAASGGSPAARATDASGNACTDPAQCTYRDLPDDPGDDWGGETARCPAAFAENNCDAAMRDGKGDPRANLDARDTGCRSQIFRALQDAGYKASTEGLVSAIHEHHQNPFVPSATSNIPLDGQYDTIMGDWTAAQDNALKRRRGEPSVGDPACRLLAVATGRSPEEFERQLVNMTPVDGDGTLKGSMSGIYEAVETQELVDYGAFAVASQAALAYQSEVMADLLSFARENNGSSYRIPTDTSYYVSNTSCLGESPPSSGKVNHQRRLQEKLEGLKKRYQPLFNDSDKATALATNYVASLAGMAKGIDEMDIDLQQAKAGPHSCTDCSELNRQIKEHEDLLDAKLSAVPILSQPIRVDGGEEMPLYKAIAALLKLNQGKSLPIRTLEDYVKTAYDATKWEAITRLKHACAHGADGLKEEGLDNVGIPGIARAYMSCGDVPKPDNDGVCSMRHSFGRGLCYNFFNKVVQKNAATLKSFHWKMVTTGVELAMAVASVGASEVLAGAGELAEAGVVESTSGEEFAVSLTNLKKAAEVRKATESFKDGLTFAGSASGVVQGTVALATGNSRDLDRERNRVLTDFQAGWKSYADFARDWNEIKEARRAGRLGILGGAVQLVTATILGEQFLKKVGVDEKVIARVSSLTGGEAQGMVQGNAFEVADQLLNSGELKFDEVDIKLTADQISVVRAEVLKLRLAGP